MTDYRAAYDKAVKVRIDRGQDERVAMVRAIQDVAGRYVLNVNALSDYLDER